MKSPTLMVPLALLLACGTRREETTPAPVPSPLPVVALLEYTTVALNVEDYGGKYKLDAWARVYTDDLRGEFHANVYDLDGEFLTGGDYPAVATTFALDQTGQVDTYDFPVITFYQYVVVDEIDCELEVEGIATLDGWFWEDACLVQYIVEGTTWLSCYGEEMTLPLATAINEPGTFVGAIDSWLWYDETTAPECPYAEPTPSPSP